MSSIIVNPVLKMALKLIFKANLLFPIGSMGRKFTKRLNSLKRNCLLSLAVVTPNAFLLCSLHLFQ